MSIKFKKRKIFQKILKHNFVQQQTIAELTQQGNQHNYNLNLGIQPPKYFKQQIFIFPKNVVFKNYSKKNVGQKQFWS